MAHASRPRRDLLAYSAYSLSVSPDPVPLGTSLQRAAERMDEEGLPVLFANSPDGISGILTQADLLLALAEGASPAEAIDAFVRTAQPIIPGNTTGSEAFRQLHHHQTGYVVVVDVEGQPLGFITPSRLLHTGGESMRPRMVGGMATPLGVYLTNGQVGAGANWVGLILTGMVMFFFFLVGAFAMLAVKNSLPASAQSEPWFGALMEIGALAVFMLGIRLSPIAGIHGAEHMVVHAIERGEELEPEIVRRMPRIHPRCGTNLAAAMMIFLGIMGWEDGISSLEIRVLTAIVVTLIAWKPVGQLMQQFVTTCNPSPSQLESGLRAGRELLVKNRDAGLRAPTPIQRILSSGVLQIMVGALALQFILGEIMKGLNLPDNWRVF